MPKLWNRIPLHTALLELLRRKRNGTTDVDLFEELRSSIDGLNFKEFNKTLMKLEIDGIIHVTNLAKDKRRVENATKS